MPALLTLLTLPPTDRLPLYEKYGTKPEAPNTAPDPSLRMEQPMRDPSYACTMNARPEMSADVPPVDTLTDPLALPAEVDVYAMLVQGSDVTDPV